MSARRLNKRAALVAVPLALIVACGGSSTQTGSGGGGSATAEAGSSSGGVATLAGAANGGGGKLNGSAGVGGGAPTAGSVAAAGQAGVTSTGGSGGSSSAGGSGGALSTAGTSGSGGGGGSPSTGCPRELLKATAEAYLNALPTHDPKSLPLAGTVKHTENGKASELGAAGLWQSAHEFRWTRSALDTEACQVASQAVIMDDDRDDLPVALRLKLENQKITESELIVVRAGDYSLASDPIWLAGSDQSVHWEKTVPDDMRNQRADYISWMTKYYTQFPNGVCSTVDTCKRIENGSGNFVCNDGARCDATGPTTAVLKTRLVLVDVQAGLGVGFTMFAGGYTDMHTFKMYGGKVYAVSAILSKADSSGWD